MQPEIIKKGDDSGNRMVLKYEGPDSIPIYAIGVPQAWASRLGPTWSYVFESDRLTVVDPGCYGTVDRLEQGLQTIGYSSASVGRVIVTHGHVDHDGNCYPLLSRNGAELWAHEVYGWLARLGRREIETDWRRTFPGYPVREDNTFTDRVTEHERQISQLTLSNPVTDGLTANGLTFYYTPGHSPDELCIRYGDMLFSGDHVLPQITPHPSVGLSYQRFQQSLPDSYKGGNRYYGLAVYLRSLKRVSGLGDEITVLPAHRAFYHGNFNPINLERSTEILEHHRDRCGDLLKLVREGMVDLAAITRKHFDHIGLDDRMFYPAFTEVISHMELLQEAGDVAMWADGGSKVRWKGTEAYSEFIDNLYDPLQAV
jgi:glyoxylase-like metal-dependent hydrolase (beta-lactamase superfamily II)